MLEQGKFLFLWSKYSILFLLVQSINYFKIHVNLFSLLQQKYFSRKTFSENFVPKFCVENMSL